MNISLFSDPAFVRHRSHATELLNMHVLCEESGRMKRGYFSGGVIYDLVHREPSSLRKLNM